MSQTDTDGSFTSLLDPSLFPQVLESVDNTVHVELRYDPLDIQFVSQYIRSARAGANVLFLGTTRDRFNDRPVSHLSYQAYPKLALKTLRQIASEVREKHALEKVVIVHRLGEVPIGEESIIVGVSSGHRGAGWHGAEEMLERVKERAEIWKREWFSDNDVAAGTLSAIWKANKDTNGYGVPTT